MSVVKSCSKDFNMFTILSIVLLATNCYSQKTSFDVDFNLNEVDSEIIPLGSGKSLAVDPSIAEDARITVVKILKNIVMI